MHSALPSAWVLVLISAGLGGCLGGPAADGPAADAPQTLLPSAPPGAAPFTFLACADGSVVELVLDRAGACNVQVTTENGPAAEVSLAVNPLDPLNLVGGAKDFTLGEDPDCGKYNVWSGVYWSRDGGFTWGNGLLPGFPGDARETALSDYPCASDPVLAFGPDGTVYYSSLAVELAPDQPPHPALGPIFGSQAKAAIGITRSVDGGETWLDPVLAVTRDDKGGGLDKQWLAVDWRTGRIYLSYFDISAGDLKVQRSDDGARTWAEPVEVAAPADMPPDLLVQFAEIAVGAAGRVHLVYFRAGVGEDVSAVYHRASDDGGATWTEAAPIAQMSLTFELGVTRKYRMVGMPALAADPADGSVHVAFPTRDPHDLDVLAITSTDGGTSWNAPVRITDDTPAARNDQWMPAIAVGPDGVVHVTWIDYREDPAGQFARIFYAYSTDEGATWSANVPISDVPFDGTGGYHQSGSGTIGDYMGLAVSPLAVHPFWADTRGGRNDVFAATILG